MPDLDNLLLKNNVPFLHTLISAALTAHIAQGYGTTKSVQNKNYSLVGQTVLATRASMCRKISSRKAYSTLTTPTK